MVSCSSTTDVYTTLAYARYLFGRELPLRSEWLAAANNDLCLFTQPDAPYVQDGTRLEPPERAGLAAAHWQARQQSEVKTLINNGKDWSQRTALAERLLQDWGLVNE